MIAKRELTLKVSPTGKVRYSSGLCEGIRGTFFVCFVLIMFLLLWLVTGETNAYCHRLSPPKGRLKRSLVSS